METAPDWPAPPLMPHMLFESPWLPCVVLLTAAAACALVGWRRAVRGPMIAGAVLAALAAGLLAVAFSVTTDREQMLDRTKSLVRAAVVPVDIDSFGEILSRDVRLYDRGYDQILATMQRSTQRWAVGQAYVTWTEVYQSDDTRGQTYLSVITRINAPIGGGSAHTRWILHWTKESDGAWRVTKIEWLTLNGSSAREGDLP